MPEASSAYFQNKKCAFFPCHEGADEDDFNCLFCYCPLYMLGERCGGRFTYTEDGVKDCSACIFPHKRENYEAVLSAFPKIAKLAEKKEVK